MQVVKGTVPFDNFFLHGDGQDGAHFLTLSAGDAVIVVDFRDVVCRCDGLHGAESADGFQGFAAAAAAVAHEGGMLADIFAHLDQVVAVGHLEDFLCLRFVDRPCVAAVLGQRARDIAEGQAGLHGGIQLAGDAQMIVLVAAETGADADEISLFNDVGRPLVVQDVVGLLCHKNRLVDKDPPQLCIHSQEEIFDEILLHVDVLIKKLTQVFLVNIAPGPHQGEFEKADHGRGEDKLAHSAVIGVYQKPLFTEVVKQFLRFSL